MCICMWDANSWCARRGQRLILAVSSYIPSSLKQSLIGLELWQVGQVEGPQDPRARPLPSSHLVHQVCTTTLAFLHRF